ncbi:hypothetical protein ACHHYP_20848 [Achlya hypogyna]|uniref:Uncharacterized protein n=1 Tax=Achlya hypogyna TaxID=1202772 RepID=A0A1V9ZDS7_ACHHY|nr:hypothetical protein ACHHYP_20848 [Achlya hypogyna]
MAPITKERCDEISAFYKRERSRTLTRVERLLIVRLQAYYRAEGVADATALIARIIDRSLGVVQRVWREFETSGVVAEATVAGNRTNHATRVPTTKTVRDIVQSFVRGHRQTRSRVVAKDVLALLQHHGHVTVNSSDQKAMATCLRSVQNYLSRGGFKCGVRKGVRDKYIQNWQPCSGAQTPGRLYT